MWSRVRTGDRLVATGGPPKARAQQELSALEALCDRLAAAGANLTLELPGGRPSILVGDDPGLALVRLHEEGAARALEKGDLLEVAEAYLRGQIDVAGDFDQVIKLTEVLAPGPSFLDRMRLGAELLLRDRRRFQRDSVSFHYDRPPEFFLPWLERWRSYSHGIYLSSDCDPSEAQERKFERAIQVLGVRPGNLVFDMGCGWGAFLEYAGSRGIHVHGITISEEQHRFVERLIAERGLPCSVELVDLLDFEPSRRFDGAVFMGTLEHFTDHGRVAAFLAEHLQPGGRVWADFCSERSGFQVGAFLARHVFPGTARYVNVPKLVGELLAAGFNVHELVDDTRSYALTCRDWADRLDAEAKPLSERFGEESVRAFRVYLRASRHFLQTNRTQAYHLVAGLEPREGFDG